MGKRIFKQVFFGKNVAQNAFELNLKQTHISRGNMSVEMKDIKEKISVRFHEVCIVNGKRTKCQQQGIPVLLEAPINFNISPILNISKP